MRSECGKYWYGLNTKTNRAVKYHYHASQEHKSNLWFRIKHNWGYYWKFQAYLGTIEFIKGCKGFVAEYEKLLLNQPNHYYKGNIWISIDRNNESIKMGEGKLMEFPKWFRVVYLITIFVKKTWQTVIIS